MTARAHHESTQPALAAVVEEYLAALETGKAPDRAALFAAHPDLAGSLALVLRGLDFVQVTAKSLASEIPEAGAAPSLQLLGDYRLVRELGRGGMAVVYEAEQISLRRRVALKILPFAAVLDPKQLQRFKNEALAAAHLNHPHIVPVHAVGCERGVHYYAMQYIDGPSLALAIRDLRAGNAQNGARTPISSHGSNHERGFIRMATELGIQAAEALDYSHQLGIVHRDVKPGNLLIDPAGALWVTDFGLASAPHDLALTVTGEMLGTVRYMSPEQALAKRVPIDHRTDIYSLGATLYELFTLAPAFPGDDPHCVVQDIALKDPVPPRKLNPAMPRDLDTILLKSLAKDPSSRYATAQEMADDLRRCLDDKPILARRPSAAARAAKWSRRHRGLVASAVIVAFVGTVALAIGAKQEEQNTKAALAKAAAALTDARTNLALARSAVDKFLLESGIPEMKEGILPAPARRALLEEALKFYLTQPEDGVTLHRRATILHKLRDYPEALAALERAIEIEPDSPEVLISYGHMLWHAERGVEALAIFDRAVAAGADEAAAHYYRGRALLDLDRFEEALEAHDRAIAINDHLAHMHAGRGYVLEEMGRFEEALAAQDRALAIEPLNAEALSGRGNALSHLNRFAESLAAYDRAIEVEPRFGPAYSNRGDALVALGRNEEAMAACDKSLELDPDNALAHGTRANALMALGRTSESLAEFEQSLEILPNSATIHYNFGNALRTAGDPQGAIREFREAIRLKPDSAKAHCNLANLLADSGDSEGAIREYLEALRIDPDLPEAHLALGITYYEQLDYDGAAREYREAIRCRPGYAKAHGNLGLTLARQGHFQEALPSLRTGQELGADFPPRDWVESVARKAELEGRLERVLSGEDRAQSALERGQFAGVLYAKSRHVEAARMWVEAFAEDPTLAEDINKPHRYNAACCAALAAACGGVEAPEWRSRALAWLRAELAACQPGVPNLARRLSHWKRDTDFAAVREQIDALPESERAAWREFWIAVDAALAGAEPEAR